MVHTTGIEASLLEAMTQGLAPAAELPGAKWHPAQSWLPTSFNVLRQICRACRYSSRLSSQGRIPRLLAPRDPHSQASAPEREWVARGDIPFRMVRGKGFTLALRILQ
jgi:hypothetical protein